MKTKEIELEFRAEINIEDFDKTLNLLRKEAVITEESKRLTVMFTGDALDVRVRIKKGKKAEVVFKSGDLHSHDRLERSQEIEKTQIVGLVKCFALLPLESKITERENYDFSLNEGVEVTLVRAKNICYIEFETKTTTDDIESNRTKILEIMKRWNFKPIDKNEFDDLCNRLSKFSDKKFNGSDDDDVLFLEETLKNY